MGLVEVYLLIAHILVCKKYQFENKASCSVYFVFAMQHTKVTPESPRKVLVLGHVRYTTLLKWYQAIFYPLYNMAINLLQCWEKMCRSVLSCSNLET